MKTLLFLTIFISLLSGCGKGGGSDQRLDLKTAVIGSWERVSVSIKGQSVNADRPDPKDPFRKLNVSELMQLKITENELSLISTNLVDFNESKISYKIEGNKIVTLDEESYSMTDFVVHSYSLNSMTLELNSDGGTNSGLHFIFKRIDESQLAIHTAQSVSFAQRLKVQVAQEGKPDRVVEKEVKGRNDYAKVGVHDMISCDVMNAGGLRVFHSLVEVMEDRIGSSSRDVTTFEFQDLKLDLSGPVRTLTSTSATKVTLPFDPQWAGREMKNCQSSVDRKGAALEILSNCSSEDGKTKVSLEVVCLLKDGATPWR